jgi:hypothetical protein
MHSTMSSPFDAIVYGPFKAEYHRVLVDDSFKRALSEFLASKLLPQLDHAFTDATGTLSACFDEDRFCGPNSLVRDCFRLEFAFRGADGESRIKTEVVYNLGGLFAVRRGRRGYSLYLWTPSRQRKRQSEQEAIQRTVRAILDHVNDHPSCPLCSAALKVVDAPALFDVVCPNRCFNYNFHRDEKGEPLHGHFFMCDPREDA